MDDDLRHTIFKSPPVTLKDSCNKKSRTLYFIQIFCRRSYGNCNTLEGLKDLNPLMRCFAHLQSDLSLMNPGEFESLNAQFLTTTKQFLSIADPT